MSDVTHALEGMAKEYRETSAPIRFDFKSSCQSILNDNTKKRNGSVHYFHYYPGRIYPYIPLYLLSLKDFFDCERLIDPFAGSGTVLLEALINPVKSRSALGVEINPLARLITKTKTTPLDRNRLFGYLWRIEKCYDGISSGHDEIPGSSAIFLWFSPPAVDGLSKLRKAIKSIEMPVDYRDFFWVCFSAIIRKSSKANPYIPPPVFLKPEKYKNTGRYAKMLQLVLQSEAPDVPTFFRNTVAANIEKIGFLERSLIEEQQEGRVCSLIWDDARSIKKGSLLERGRLNKDGALAITEGIDLILTSPPYLSAQKYVRTSRLELLWLGFSDEEIRAVEVCSIGTEKVSTRTETEPFKIVSVDQLVEKTCSVSSERGIILFSYFDGMLKSLQEMYRVLKKGGCAILVVGNNKVLGEWIDTYALLADIAISVGFRLILVLRDEIRGRSMMTKRNGTGGLIKNEFIVVLKKEG